MASAELVVGAGGLGAACTILLLFWLRGQAAELRRRRAREAWLLAARQEASAAGRSTAAAPAETDLDHPASAAHGAEVSEPPAVPAAHDLARAEDVLEVLGSFAGGVAGDFGDQFTTILGHAELMAARRPDDPLLRQSLAEIRAAAEEGRRATRQLVAFSRSGLRRSGRNLLAPLVDEACDGVAARTGVRFVVRASPCAAAVEGSPDELRVALEALLENAAQATRSGEVLVRCEASGRDGDADEGAIRTGVRVSVLDDGPGLPTGARADVFRAGFTTRAGAHGLGLPLAYTLAARNGGRIVLRDAREAGFAARGTLAELHLVRAHPAAVGGPAAQAVAPGGRATVLVVEDEPHVLRLMETVLERDGHRVLPATSADQALRLAAAEGGRLDLLVTDVVLPGTDGLDLAERLFESVPGLPVVYTSGSVEAEELHAQLLGAVPYFVQKPFTVGELTEVVRRALADAAPGSSTRRVLVVDDEPTTRRLVGALVQEAGYDCVEAADGAEALALLRRTSFDLVLTDIVMPVMDGLDLIRALHAGFPTVRVVAMSGRAGGRAVLGGASSLGVEAVLTKPFSRDELVLVLRQVLADDRDEAAAAA